MKPFARRRRGGIYATFEAHEAALVANLAAQVVELLSDGEAEPKVVDPRGADADDLEAMLDLDEPRAAPDDPVVARLLPDAYRDDEEKTAEFRRFTEGALRTQKIASATHVINSLTEGGLIRDAGGDLPAPLPDVEVELGERSVQAWLRCLTDLRLALGTRLSVEEDDDERWAAFAPDDPDVLMHEIYEWLGYVQETLLAALR